MPLDEQSAFANLALSKKRKDAAAAAQEEAEGREERKRTASRVLRH